MVTVIVLWPSKFAAVHVVSWSGQWKAVYSLLKGIKNLSLKRHILHGVCVPTINVWAQHETAGHPSSFCLLALKDWSHCWVAGWWCKWHWIMPLGGGVKLRAPPSSSTMSVLLFLGLCYVIAIKKQSHSHPKKRCMRMFKQIKYYDKEDKMRHPGQIG